MEFIGYIVCIVIGTFMGRFIFDKILDKTSTLSREDNEAIKQALKDQINDIRVMSNDGYREELPALSNALCELVNTLKKL